MDVGLLTELIHLPGATSLGKPGPPSPRSHQLSTAPRTWVGAHDSIPTHVRVLTGLILCAGKPQLLLSSQVFYVWILPVRKHFQLPNPEDTEL